MSDLIDRQVAIDALREAENHAFNSFYQGLIKAHKIIAGLPSAEPERTEERTKTHSCDLISRQAAIDALEANKRSNEKKGQILCADEDEIIKWLNSAPSVSEYKTGRWIVHGKPPMYVIECDKCGQKYFNHALQTFANYCSNCGAKMEVEHER